MGHVPKHEVRMIAWKRKIPRQGVTRKQDVAARSEESKRQQVSMRRGRRSVPMTGLSEGSVVVVLGGQMTVHLVQAGISNFSEPSGHAASSRAPRRNPNSVVLTNTPKGFHHGWSLFHTLINTGDTSRSLSATKSMLRSVAMDSGFHRERASERARSRRTEVSDTAELC